MNSVFELANLSLSRDTCLNDLLRETRVFSKRAVVPEDRVALAELERELLNVRERWVAVGLIEETKEAA